jgi:subtilisin family serine protease
LPQAIRWAVDHGADVINMSLGGSRTPGADRDSCPAEEQAAIYYALNKGAVLVAAVGNSGPTKNTIEEPGVCLGVISVGAVDASGTVADFSSRQPYLTMTAPGVNVPSLSRVDDEGYSGDGTSQATAIVSAVVALTWSKHRSASGRDIVTRLLNTLDDRRQTPSSAYGYGIVDGYRAVTAAVSAGAPNPVYDAVTPFLARANATSAKLVRPHAAARGELGAGGYAVHPPHWYTDTRIVGGLSSAGAGLLVLGMLLLVGLRARRRQPVARPAPLPPVPAPMPYQLPGVVIQPWPPRPLPAPRPGAPGDPGQ